MRTLGIGDFRDEGVDDEHEWQDWANSEVLEQNTGDGQFTAFCQFLISVTWNQTYIYGCLLLWPSLTVSSIMMPKSGPN